jgi:hypothetical protein
MEDICWIATRSISKAAETAIKNVGGKIMRICSSGNVPSMIVVGLPCQSQIICITGKERQGCIHIL